MDNLLGKRLEGRYLIEELIGVGGMANVYKAFDTAEQRPVAIKMLRDEYVDNEDFLRRFRNESKAIYSLNHPNIVKIFDVILTTKNPVIVMEYVDGITLKDYIEKKGVVGVRSAIALTMQLLLALQHAHENGIVHRDVKPQNIMVLADGTIKVMDFGIARFAMSQSRTITDRAIGSVHYISPEQARGDGVLDTRADIYSVGVILFEMITGRLPFEADTPVSVALKQIQDKPMRPRSLNPNLPQGLEDITIKAMAKNPDLRYQNAGEMLRDLQSFVRNPDIIFGYAALDLSMDHKSEAQKFIEKENGETQMTSKPRKRQNSPEEERKETAGRKKRRKVSALTVLFGITCAFILGTAIFVGAMLMMNNPFEHVPEVDMPDLVGKSYEQVIKDKNYKSFKFEVEEQTFNTTYEKGLIYEQFPTSGKRVKEGITIKVKVSSGAQSITLQDFAGQESTLVFAKLKELGLKYSQASINSDTVPEGYVVKTEPGKNETVTTGSQIVVYVSSGTGKEMVQVPQLVAEDLEYAKELLEENGLLLGNISYEVSMMPEGTVLSQAPNYPARVPMGSKVNVTVSSDEEVTSKKLTLLMLLPGNMNTQVKVTAEMNGAEVYSTTLIPASQRALSVTVQGEGENVVDIKINGVLYQSWKVNFDTEEKTKLVDNIEQFEAQASQP
ncbi:MAG: Stk1 family PASTA domain-containing Ser/Thr kinase [Angelakisella sp.]|nr:Stk1 family PASTA domain-containing Ser/Thr kinase [Angelakisella sp.]